MGKISNVLFLIGRARNANQAKSYVLSCWISFTWNLSLWRALLYSCFMFFYTLDMKLSLCRFRLTCMVFSICTCECALARSQTTFPIWFWLIWFKCIEEKSILQLRNTNTLIDSNWISISILFRLYFDVDKITPKFETLFHSRWIKTIIPKLSCRKIHLF